MKHFLATLLLATCLPAQDRALDQAARLDSERHCSAAEEIYQREFAARPSSTPLLNNLGNHYLSCGEPAKAQAMFERLLEIAPAHANARLQLARLALQRRNAKQALVYLSGLAGHDPEVTLTRAEALQQAGDQAAAEHLIEEVTKDSKGDPQLQFALGLSCARMGFYVRAESAFEEVLRRFPGDFEVLYNAGVASGRAGHSERAERLLEAALKQKSEDTDTLYQLGRVEASLGKYPRAVFALAQARKQDARRAEIVLALARAAQMAGYYGDCLLAYDDYLKLKPDDDLVRRDRALVKGFSKGGLQEGLADLNDYVKAHPADAVGFYDLAQLSDRKDRSQALAYVSQATRIDPRFEPAQYYRGWLLNELGRYEEAIPAASESVRLNPKDVSALDLLGLVYLNIERPAQAEPPLRRAVALAPDAPEPLFHLGKALMELGRSTEAKPILTRFQKAREAPPRQVLEQPGIIESATLSPAERERRVLSQLRIAAREKPDEPELKLSLGTALLETGNRAEAMATFDDLFAGKPAPAIAESAGTALLRFEQYAAARKFLELAVVERPEARMDLALAVFFTGGGDAALRILDQVASNSHEGDEFLLRALVLEAAGRASDADQAIQKSLQCPIVRPRLAEEVAVSLLRHRRYEEALDVVSQALKSSPRDSGLLLARAVTLASLNRMADARQEVREIEVRLPEWNRPYLVEGLLLERGARRVDANRPLEIAQSLSAQDPEALCALALAGKNRPGNANCVCAAGIFESFFPRCVP